MLLITGGAIDYPRYLIASPQFFKILFFEGVTPMNPIHDIRVRILQQYDQGNFSTKTRIPLHRVGAAGDTIVVSKNVGLDLVAKGYAVAV